MADVARMPTRPRHSTQSPDDNDREIAGCVARLLLHYFAPGDLSEQARIAMAQDWLEDLREFGPRVVADACMEWRRTSNRRPTPSDIRLLCIAAHRRQSEKRALAAPDNMDEYARSVGWASNTERIAAIRRDEAEREARYERARTAREAITR